MRAVVFADFGRVEVADVAAPELLDAGDALVRVTRAAICGSDLHIVNGRIPGMTEGSVLGHEFVGIVEAVGTDVTGVRAGERVVGSFLIPCGACWYCDRRFFNRCQDQRVFGYGSFYGDVNGAQAERVRVPNAQWCLRSLGEEITDEQALFAGDVFTTGYDAAAQAGISPGEVVVVQGCGPVGLCTVLAAATFEPAVIYAVDTVPARLAMARQFGAVPVDAGAVHVPSHLQDLTGGRGADTVLECVGAIPALLQALDTVRPGGRICVVGVYSEPEIELPLNTTWVRGLDIRFGGTANIPGRWDAALELMRTGRADPTAMISHRLPLEEAVEGYRLFAGREAMKVVLTP